MTSHIVAMAQCLGFEESHIDGNDVFICSEEQLNEFAEAVARVPAVKSLVWHAHPDGDTERYEGVASVGSNYVVFKAWWGMQKKWGWVGNDSFHHSEEEAKIACSNDYYDRVRSALIYDCEICGGDCAAANPLEMNCPRDARKECERRGIDPDEICADGGVTAEMVVAKESSCTGYADDGSPCDCARKMGNDFFFLPKGSCLRDARKEREHLGIDSETFVTNGSRTKRVARVEVTGGELAPRARLIYEDVPLGVREWIEHKLTDESWQRWREENPKEVATMRELLESDQ